mmetsp:Transcript_2954/g.8193  ORF Transcript_2954/g.8193 Transcript_2954/m.8193 type:complete len:537 (+) Transcript_2954:98-1708(+)
MAAVDTVVLVGDNSEAVAPTLLARAPEAESQEKALKPEEYNHGPDKPAFREKLRAMLQEPEGEPSYLMQFLLCAVAALEGADTALLPAAMLALQKDIGLHLSDLAYLSTAQAVCTNLAAPFWGIMADRGILQRKSILIIGSLGQGFVTCLLALVTIMGPMIFMRAANGALLAALRPISNGIVADMTAESKRGKMFGRVQSSLMFGMLITTLVAVPMANMEVLGIQGWRVAFCLIGLVSVIVSALVLVFMKEPPREEAVNQSEGGGGCKAVVEEIQSLTRFFRIPTFCVMIMQGIFGTIPWSVMGNMTLYFQLSGMQDSSTALLSSINLIAGMFGNVIAGYVADFLAAKFGYHGRPLSAQITVALGIPCIYMLFYGIYPGEGSFGGYLTLILAFGLLGSWAQSGTNFPILSAIVPSSARSRIMAWECALENSIANALGPMVVALLATNCFGYRFGETDIVESEEENLASARALGTAMTVVVCLPWVICFLAYSILHWSYPRDMKIQAQEEQKVAAKKAAEPSVQISTEAGVDVAVNV